MVVEIEWQLKWEVLTYSTVFQAAEERKHLFGVLPHIRGMSRSECLQSLTADDNDALKKVLIAKLTHISMIGRHNRHT